MKTLLYTVGFVIVAMVIARLLPIDTEPFHEDPAEPDARHRSEVRMIGQDAPRFPADAETVLETLIGIVRREWNAGLVEGSVDEGMLTFVARSPVFGFRDFITVKATDEADMSKLAVFARPRFDLYDWGSNARRLDRWLGELDQTLRR